MKRILTILALLFVFSTAVYSVESFGQNTVKTTQSIFTQMGNAIYKDVQNTIDNTVNAGVNTLKLASYKAELAQKKNELNQLETSKDNFFLKTYKRIKLKHQIKDLEHKIADLEKQMQF